MKINKFLKDINDFFKSNKKEKESLLDALEKLYYKKLKLISKIENNDFSDEANDVVEGKIVMVEDMIKKIEKRVKKLT